MDHAPLSLGTVNAMTDVYQLKVTLLGTKPPVWRRLLVRPSTTLLSLHQAIQAAFGWAGYHLHEFEIDGVRYGTDDGEGWGPPPKDERRVRIGDVAAEGTKVDYVYDFGDDWRHLAVVEKLVAAERGASYPRCTGGRRACPPEDCGGVWGYQDFIEAISSPDHDQHEEMLEWVGGSFDPAAFDPSDFSRNLQMAREMGSLDL